MRAWLVILVLTLVSATAFAQDPADRATARDLFFEGTRAAKQGDHAAAEVAFRKANALYPAPTAALGWARALVAQSRLVEAHEVYRAIIRSKLDDDAGEAFVAAVDSARTEYRDNEARLPRLRVTVAGPRVPEVFLDGKPLSAASLGVKRFVDPGRHEIRAGGKGFVEQRRTVEVAEGAVEAVAFELEAKEGQGGDDVPPPEPASSMWRPVGFVSMGLGGAALIGAAVTGGLYAGEAATVDEHCSELSPGRFGCDQQGLDASDQAQTLGSVNTALLVAGTALVGVGLTLLLVSGDEQQAAIRVDLSGERVAGTFEVACW